MATLKVGISNLNAVDLAAKALRLHTMMSGNVNFPTPLPDMASFLVAMTALNTAITESATKDSNKIVARNLRSKELKELIKQLGAHVQSVSNGDADKILSSGFELRKQPTPVGVVGQPQSLVARATLIVGEIRLYWASVNGAYSYQIEHKDLGFTGDGGVTPTPGMPTPGPGAATWNELKSLTSSGFSASGLVSGHIYQFRVRALGASGYGAWSDLAQERAR